MWSLAFALAFLPAILSQGSDAQAQPAFPGAVGFGAQATGWRYGSVIKITNTNDSGAGSARACLEATGPRVCLPTLGGTIDVESSILIKSDVYLAGQAAPDDSGGLQFRLNSTDNTSSSPILIIDAKDVMMRHVRVRPGPGLVSNEAVDAITVQDSSNLMFANLSLAYSTDELFNVDADTDEALDITLQNSIMLFALDESNHAQGRHSKAVLICSIRVANAAAGNLCGRITLAFNLFAHNRDRNPDLESAGAAVEVYNNYIYNPGTEAMEFHDGVATAPSTSATVMNNLFISGNDTVADIPFIRVADDLADQGLPGEVEYRVYARGNIDPFARDDSGLAEDLTLDPVQRDTVLDEPEGVLSGPFYAAEDLQAIIPDIAGARKPALDQLDINATNQARNGSGGSSKDSPAGVTGANLTGGYPTPAVGTPETDTDGDGMPDTWETAIPGGLPDDFDAWGDRDGNGWSNIEDYLNCLAGDLDPDCDPRT